jgi:hypothetical protein
MLWSALPAVMLAAPVAQAADPAAPNGQAQVQPTASGAPIGRITAAFGHTSIYGADGKRDIDLHAAVSNDDRIQTNGGGVSVLLASRVVLKVDPSSAVSVREGEGVTSIVLERGTVHVFVGQRPADSGNVVVQDPYGRCETVNGVFLASHNADTKESYYACEHSTITVQGRDDAVGLTLQPDQQAIVRHGKLDSTGELDRLAFLDHKKSMDQLGQSIIERGTATFRMRSRMFDSELALAQLEGAGWIKRADLVRQQGQQQAQKKSGNKKANSGGDTGSDGSSSSDDSGSQTLAASSEPGQAPRQAPDSGASEGSSGASAASSAGSSPAPITPVAGATPALPAQVESPSQIQVTGTQTPSTPAIVSSEPGAPIGGVPTPPAEPPVSVTLDAPVSTPPVVPVVTEVPTPRGNESLGGAMADSTVSVPPKADLGLGGTTSTPAPKSLGGAMGLLGNNNSHSDSGSSQQGGPGALPSLGDTAVGNNSTPAGNTGLPVANNTGQTASQGGGKRTVKAGGGIGKAMGLPTANAGGLPPTAGTALPPVKTDLGLGGATSGGTRGAVPPAGGVNLGLGNAGGVNQGSGAPVPKVDLGLGGGPGNTIGGATPPRASLDLGGATAGGQTRTVGGSALGGIGKVGDVAPSPVIPKIDRPVGNVSGTVIPKADFGSNSGGSPVIPKPDSSGPGGGVTGGATAGNSGSGSVPKVDLGNLGGSAAPPVPKLDLDIPAAGDVGGGAAGGAIPKLDLGGVTPVPGASGDASGAPATPPAGADLGGAIPKLDGAAALPKPELDLKVPPAAGADGAVLPKPGEVGVDPNAITLDKDGKPVVDVAKVAADATAKEVAAQETRQDRSGRRRDRRRN